MSRCSKLWIARCDPQPGHFSPVMARKGQRGKKPLVAGLKMKYTATKISNAAIADRQRVVCFLFMFKSVCVQPTADQRPDAPRGAPGRLSKP